MYGHLFDFEAAPVSPGHKLLPEFSSRALGIDFLLILTSLLRLRALDPDYHRLRGAPFSVAPRWLFVAYIKKGPPVRRLPSTPPPKLPIIARRLAQVFAGKIAR
jgi:hypothetical protein